MESLNKNIEVAKLFNEVVFLVKHNMGGMFEKMGVTMPQGIIVGTLSEFGKMKVSELSSKVGLSNSTVSVILDRLEDHGIVERKRSKEDKRAVYVNISGKFCKTHGELHEKINEKLKNIISKGSQEDIDKIIEGFTTFKRILNDYKDSDIKEKDKI
ncbi:MarR family transcriptional regulator [bacterium]|nr:MarR family transcriptional regulator [bacterium]